MWTLNVNARMRTEIDLNESEVDQNESEIDQNESPIDLNECEIDLNECKHFLKANLDWSEIDLSACMTPYSWKPTGTVEPRVPIRLGPCL